jgi:thymidylate synthase (FAD)
VSYGTGTKSVREDKALIHYLIRNLHTSPFEQVILTFHAKMPIFVARQRRGESESGGEHRPVVHRS